MGSCHGSSFESGKSALQGPIERAWASVSTRQVLIPVPPSLAVDLGQVTSPP